MEQYRTKDIGEAAALLTLGIELLPLEYDSAGFYWFVFENGQYAKSVAHTYWFGNLMQNVKRYNESLSTLKDRIFANRG